MKPVYFVAKISAILGAVVVLWQNGFVLFSSVPDMADKIMADKVALGVALSSLGSLFENNVMLNKIIGMVTQFVGVPHQETPAPVDPTKPAV